MNIQNAIDVMGRGLEYKRMGNYQASLSSYLQAERVLGNEPDLYKGLGKIYYILGQNQKAVDAYEKCIRLIRALDTSVLMHMGHAICDAKAVTSEQKALVEKYRDTIDPFFAQHGSHQYGHVKVGVVAQEEYQHLCINTAASWFQ